MDNCNKDDCQQDHDLCVDCVDGSKYRSPDQPDLKENK